MVQSASVLIFYDDVLEPITNKAKGPPLPNPLLLRTQHYPHFCLRFIG